MMRFLTLSVSVIIAMAPLFGNAQSGTKNQTNNKNQVVTPVTLTPDTSKMNSGGKPANKASSPTTPQGAVLKKPVDSLKVKARDYYQSGAKKAEAKDYEGAIRDFNKSLSYNSNPVILTKRAYAYMLINQYDSAIVDAMEGYNKIRNNSEAMIILGISYYEKQNYDEAYKFLVKASRLQNKNPLIFNYLAAIKFMQKDYKSALLYYDSVVMRDSAFLEVFSNRGMMQHYLGNYKDAINDYSMAIMMDSTNASAYNNRAAARIILKEFSPALNDLNNAIRLNPEYSNAYENRGKVKLQLGDKEGACADWTKALSMGLESSKELIIKNCK
jgi:tetratricopeptide (TPR) repeat protein